MQLIFQKQCIHVIVIFVMLIVNILWFQIDNGTTSKSFTFNVTFEPEATQEDVFDHSGIKKLIEMALNG